jgi:hypothetical protein
MILKGLAPFVYIWAASTKEPDRFRVGPTQFIEVVMTAKII